MTKAELRRFMRDEASARLAGDAQTEDSAVWDRLEALDEFRSARTVLIYMSLPDEVATAPFIEKWKDRKRFVIPKVNGDNLDLKLYDPDKLESGYKGILEPTDEAQDVSAEEIDLALVPGVAFDRHGHRMGRGKGFYDRFLPALHCPTVAVCQQWRMVECVPTDTWDRIIDIIPWASATAPDKR